MLTRRPEEQDDEERVPLTMQVEKSRNLSLGQTRRRRTIFIATGVCCALSVLALVLGLVYGLRDRRQPNYACPRGFFSNGPDLTFFVIGDWGREGNSNQQAVARMMGQLGDCFKPEFVISTGDNFYDHGLKSENDPTFTKSFTDVYTADSLQVPWYAVLGNHDYSEATSSMLASCTGPSLKECPSGCCYSPLWQTQLQKRDPRFILQQGAWKLSLLNGQLDLFFIDTPPFIPKYWEKPWANIPGGILSQNTNDQKIKIKAMMQNSTAPWKLMIGHHPIRSYGHHCDNPNNNDCEAMQFLKSWLAQSKVAAYFCGHEHDLQMIKVKDNVLDSDPVYYVVSGAGSDVRKNEFSEEEVSNMHEADFFANEPGFVAASLTKDKLMLYVYVKSKATPVYTVQINRPQ